MERWRSLRSGCIVAGGNWHGKRSSTESHHFWSSSIWKRYPVRGDCKEGTNRYETQVVEESLLQLAILYFSMGWPTYPLGICFAQKLLQAQKMGNEHRATWMLGALSRMMLSSQWEHFWSVALSQNISSLSRFIPNFPDYKQQTVSAWFSWKRLASWWLPAKCFTSRSFRSSWDKTSIVYRPWGELCVCLSWINHLLVNLSPSICLRFTSGTWRCASGKGFWQEAGPCDWPHISPAVQPTREWGSGVPPDSKKRWHWRKGKPFQAHCCMFLESKPCACLRWKRGWWLTKAMCSPSLPSIRMWPEWYSLYPHLLDSSGKLDLWNGLQVDGARSKEEVFADIDAILFALCQQQQTHLLETILNVLTFCRYQWRNGYSF